MEAAALQFLEANTASDKVAAVLPIRHLDAGFRLNGFEIFAFHQSNLADIDRRPIAGPFGVAVPSEAAAFNGLDLLDRLHVDPAAGGDEDVFDKGACR